MPDSTAAEPPTPAAFHGASRAHRVLVFTLDADEGTLIRTTAEALDCTVTVAGDTDAALRAAREEAYDLVFADAGAGERRLGDLINAAKQTSAGVAFFLLATPARAEAEPNLLMMVGYEYLARPIHADTVSAEVRLRLDQQRVRRVSAALTSTLDYHGLLDVILHLAVGEVAAETASLLVPERDGGGLVLAHAIGLPEAVRARGHEARDDGIAEWVFEHGEPLILQGGFVELPVSSVSADRGITSAMVLPLILGERIMGVLCVARLSVETGPYTLRQLRALEILASQSAVALHSALTHRALLEQEKWRHELEVARAVQQQLLPRDLPTLPDVAVQAVNLPARQIGGDFYNVFRLGPARLGIVIGDVSGKGIPGALLMTQCMNDMRRAIEEESDPASVLARVNDRVSANSTRGMFVTLLYLVLDMEAKRLEYANAGHLPMLHLQAGAGAAEFVGRAQDPPLGIIPGAQFTNACVPIGRGDAVLIFTDGVVEAKNPAGAEFGFDRLRHLFSSDHPLPASLVKTVTSSVKTFVRTQAQHDDLTLLAVRITPA